MTNIVEDYKDAILDAQAEVMDVVREVVREFVLPAVEKNAKALWAKMPDEKKEQFKQERPGEYDALMKGINREKDNAGYRNTFDRAGNVQRGGNNGYKE